MRTKLTLVSVIALCGVSMIATAQIKEASKSPYQFTVETSNPVTSTKNQGGSGTCWSFSTLAMVESDVIKAGKGEHDLSDMWIARNTYFEKIVKYVRMHGHNNLAAGGNAHDITNMIRKYGIVPEEAYTGLNYGTDKHIHGEIDAVLKAYADAVLKNGNGKLSTAWVRGLNGILDSYFGIRPEKFTYQGKEYTPKSFAEALAINPDDYVSITSFTHHPYYTAFPVEIPDNWAWGLSYNVPMDEFEEIADDAIKAGYSLGWASDVSEKGFKYNLGFAIFPQTDIKALQQTEKDRWTEMTEKEINEKIMKFDTLVPEKIVTAAERQDMFDNYQTTDDHGMQIFGIAKAQDGTKFYIVKNSWGADHVMGGHFYASRPFFLSKTINYMVNKNALSKETRNKLGIK